MIIKIPSCTRIYRSPDSSASDVHFVVERFLDQLDSDNDWRQLQRDSPVFAHALTVEHCMSPRSIQNLHENAIKLPILVSFQEYFILLALTSEQQLSQMLAAKVLSWFPLQ